MRPTLWSDERAERYRRLGYWNADTSAGFVARNAARVPGALALGDTSRALTWLEVARWTDAVACALARRLERDAVLATWLPNVVESYLLRIACEKAGLIWLSVPWSAGPHELAPILAASRAAGIVLAEDARRDRWAELETASSEGALRFRCLARGAPRSGVALLGDLAAEHATRAERQATAGRALGPADLAMLVPTSGSTGTPKLCEYAVTGIVARARAQAELFGLTDSDVVAAVVQGFGPSITPLLAAPAVAAAAVLLERPDPAALVNLVARRRVTIVCGVPPVYRDLLPLLERAGPALRTVRIWYSTGMPLPADVARGLEAGTDAVALSGYGGVDLGCWTAPAPGDEAEVRHGTVGRPRGGTEIGLVDPSGAAADEGEVRGRGPSSAYGYFGDAAATRSAWTADGWFRTGDLGRFDGAGNVVLVGRTADVINRGGYKVYPHEVEQLLESHPGVARAAVVPFPDERLGERVCAYVVPTEGASVGLEDLVAFLRERGVASYKLPERLELIPRLPLSSGGKLSRRALAEDVRARLERAASSDVTARP